MFKLGHKKQQPCPVRNWLLLFSMLDPEYTLILYLHPINSILSNMSVRYLLMAKPYTDQT